MPEFYFAFFVRKTRQSNMSMDIKENFFKKKKFSFKNKKIKNWIKILMSIEFEK